MECKNIVGRTKGVPVSLTGTCEPTQNFSTEMSSNGQPPLTPAEAVKPLPHHEKEALCTTRASYRQGHKLTAVKVYGIAQESVYLLIASVPAVSLSKELFDCAKSYGRVRDFKKLTDYPKTSEFTETFLVKYSSVKEARVGKKFMDCKNFYGGSLHVCYAPELETVEETRVKLAERRNAVKRYLASQDSSSSVLKSYHPKDRLANLVESFSNAESSVPANIAEHAKDDIHTPLSQEFLEYVRNVPPPSIAPLRNNGAGVCLKKISSAATSSDKISSDSAPYKTAVGEAIYESTNASFEPGLGNTAQESYKLTSNTKRKRTETDKNKPSQGPYKINNLLERSKKRRKLHQKIPDKTPTSSVVVFEAVPCGAVEVRAAPLRRVGPLVLWGGKLL